MHLSSPAAAAIDDGDVAVDLGQTPGDIVVLSAADSELAAFAAAYATLADGFPSVRLTNLLALGHPMSVDLYVDGRCARRKIVVLRMLGGAATGRMASRACARRAAARHAVRCMPGEIDWNAALAARGTLGADADPRALALLQRGRRRERRSSRCASPPSDRAQREAPPPARPMPSAGFWRGEPADDDDASAAADR